MTKCYPSIPICALREPPMVTRAHDQAGQISEYQPILTVLWNRD